MIRLSELIGQKAIALGSAATTGTVKGVGLSGNQIVSVQLSEEVISSDAVRSFSGDVLTYDENGAKPADAVATLDPRGKRVLDMNGDGHGHIGDLTITDAGVVEAIVLDNGDSVPGTRLRAIGSYAAILTVELPPPSGTPLSAP